MSYQQINVGTSDFTFDGDSRRDTITKINLMFQELYGQAGPSNLFFVTTATDPHNADVGLQAAEFHVQGYDGTDQFHVETVPLAVSYLVVRGGTLNTMPVLVAAGSPTDIPISIAGKGGGAVLIGNGWGTLFAADDSGGSVRNDNYIKVIGNVSGAAPQITVGAFSDVNVDLQLVPLGTGNVRFGTFTGTPATSAGYITVKDAGGTVRKLMVGT